jgi:lysozyme
MRLVTDWRRVVLLSLSFWMQLAGLAVLIAPELRYSVTGQDYDPNLAWWLACCFLLAGIVGRVWQQPLSPWKEWLRIAAVIAIIIALAVIFAAPSAGRPHDSRRRPVRRKRLRSPCRSSPGKKASATVAYRDAVGIWTICYRLDPQVSLHGHGEDATRRRSPMLWARLPSTAPACTASSAR